MSSNSTTADRETLVECFKMRLELESITVGETLQGYLRAENLCEFSVAVLTAPVELRFRLDPDVRFPVEDGIDRVYAVALLFSKELGLSREVFRGDGGVEVASLPEFEVIQAGADTAIPLGSGAPLGLEPGAYGLALFTIAVPTNLVAPRSNEIDLRNTIKKLRERSSRLHRLTLTPSAVRLAPVAFFEVRKKS